MGYIENLRRSIGHQPLLLPGAAVILENEDRRILLQKRRHPQNTWGLPGGLMELGESAEETAIREVHEETGLTIDNLRLFGVYSGAMATAANGDCYYPIIIVYCTRSFRGQMRIDPEESEDYSFLDVHERREQLTLLKNHRPIIDDWLKEK